MADPQTVIRSGNGTSIVSYSLPADVWQYVQSVLVEVDTSGSGDVRPTLSVQTADGVPIAEKQQGASITGGGSGRANWALRLADEFVATHPIGRVTLVLTGATSPDNLNIATNLAPAGEFSAGNPSAAIAAGTWTMAAGKRISVTVSNNDDVGFSAVTGRMYVQRLDVIDREVLAGTGTAVTPGNGTTLSWAHTTGTALLNLASPTLPTVVSTGTYAVTVIVNVAGF